MLISEIIPSELPFSLDFVQQWLFRVVLSYIGASAGNIIGFPFLIPFISGVIVGTSTCLWDRIEVNATGKAVLIIGCDTGFGNAIARKLHQLGFIVFACCLSKESNGARKLIQDCPERMHVIQMDVSSTDDVYKAVDEIQRKLDNFNGSCGGLWAVITNASCSTFGQVEWGPIDVYQKIMDVNLFGTVRVIQATLPLIRRAKGRVITIASILGRFGPSSSRSPYFAIKYAVEGFTECLRLEMKQWDVPVVCIEPGNFAADLILMSDHQQGTRIFGGDTIQRQSDHMWNNLSQIVRDDYGKENFDRSVQNMKYFTTPGETNIDPMLNAICDAVLHSYPQTRYQTCSIHEKIRCFIATHLPSNVYDYFYA